MNIELEKHKEEEGKKLVEQWIDVVAKCVIEDLSEKLKGQVNKVLASNCLDFKEHANTNARLFISVYLEHLSVMYEPNFRPKELKRKKMAVRREL